MDKRWFPKHNSRNQTRFVAPMDGKFYQHLPEPRFVAVGPECFAQNDPQFMDDDGPLKRATVQRNHAGQFVGSIHTNRQAICRFFGRVFFAEKPSSVFVEHVETIGQIAQGLPDRHRDTAPSVRHSRFCFFIGKPHDWQFVGVVCVQPGFGFKIQLYRCLFLPHPSRFGSRSGFYTRFECGGHCRNQIFEFAATDQREFSGFRRPECPDELCNYSIF